MRSRAADAGCRAQRARPPLADDGAARRPERGRPAHWLHRCFHDRRFARATDRAETRRRLLLCLYGLGTNAGLKRLAVGNDGFTHKELLHTRRRYIDAEGLRDATRRVVNATLAARDPAIWGEGTTACAADSTHFGAFDRESHDRVARAVRRARVMIYWHVERGSVCIYRA